MTDGAIFDGVCEHSSPDYCFHEYGVDEEALEIDNFIFYASQIKKIEKLPAGPPRLWNGRTLHEMTLDHEPFRRMELGEKTVELRLNDDKRRKIEVGDIIRFEDRSDEGEVLFAEVMEKLFFPTFRELYSSLSLREIGYTEDEIPRASPDDMLKYYSEEEQAKYGVVGIRINVM